MRQLVYKELHLSINRFFFILPVLLGALMFIPNWIFSLVFMYFFWISMPQIFSGYIGQQDSSFTMMLPVSKKEIVLSKIYAIIILEATHLLIGAVFGIIHIWIYGSYNFFFDINVAFFGLIIIMFALFNLIFFPAFFKTGYYFGRPIIYGVIATLIFGFIMEFSIAKYQAVRDIFEGLLSTQFIVLIIGVVVALVMHVVTVKLATSNYESMSWWSKYQFKRLRKPQYTNKYIINYLLKF